MIKSKMIQAHLRAAQAYALTSYAKRLQVGAVIVNQLTDQPVSAGWNGMPPGEPNICEHLVDGELVSKDNVVHAEINAMSKIPPKVPRDFLTLFCTDSPCPVCAQQIVSSGIRQVIFARRYRLDEGIIILLKGGIEVYDGVSEYVLESGKIALKPAEYSSEGILVCRNYREGIKVKPYGVGKHHKGWTQPEIDTVLYMFDDYASVEEIARKTDRSYSSICTLLSRRGLLSWASFQGYMISTFEGRKLYCRIDEIAHNKRAIEDYVEEWKPQIIFCWNRHKDIDKLIEEFPKISPLFLKRIVKSINSESGILNLFKAG